MAASAAEKGSGMRSRIDVPEVPRGSNARSLSAKAHARHLAKIAARIQAGEGSGHLARYSPWLQIKRRNTSPDSNQLVAWLPLLRRSTHFFARAEYYTALLLLWLGAEDVREQYPLWPMPHPHPLDGAVGAPCNLSWSKGLLAIAAAAGIDHGYDVGTRIPYIATIDLLATVRMAGQPELIFVSSKPNPDNPAASDWRMYERLELERRYAEDLGCRYYVASSSLVSPAIASNLETWM